MTSRTAAPFALFALLLAVADTARADLMFTLDRVSDSEAIMTATGYATDPGGSGFGFTTLSLNGAVSPSLVSLLISETGDFQFGTDRDPAWIADFNQMRATGLNFTYALTDTPSGTATLEAVPGLTFAPVGSSGTVFGTWQTPTGSQLLAVGSWTMVPEAGPLPQMAMVVAVGLVGVAWRRRKGITSARSIGK